jgi:hypothetical protein
MNCSLNCGANCETCDNVKGCTKCKKKFFQDYPHFLCNGIKLKLLKNLWLILNIKLLETLPVLMRPPDLTSITDHSLTVFVNMTYEQTAKKPEYYQIQYKNVGNDSNNNFCSLIITVMFQGVENFFQNYSQPKHFHNKGNVTETIRNLSTTKLEHQIRIILIVQNQSFTDEVKTLTSRSKLLK